MNSTRRNLLPVILGIAITGVFLVLLAYMANRRRADLAATPQLTIVAPAGDAAVDSPLVVRFTSSRQLELQSTGWGTSGLHLHATVGSTQHMPAARDISTVGANTYEWVLAAVPRGSNQALQLSWADMQHHPLPQGASSQISVTVR